MSFKTWLFKENVVLIKPRRAGDGVSYGIFLKGNKKKIGHISGFEQFVSSENPYEKSKFLGSNGDVKQFCIWKTELDELFRGQGIYQDAVLQVARLYPEGGIRCEKFQASGQLQHALRKINGIKETKDDFFLIL